MSVQSRSLPPLRIESLDVERVWGGERLSADGPPIGERWGAFDGNRIAGGPLDGQTVADACRRYGEELLGRGVVERFGARFPILTKLLDTSEWLSVQLHPNDEQARELAGREQVGKTEAWHLLATAPGAEIILGLRPGVDRERFAAAVRSGATLDVIARQPASAGDTWFIPAGTVHALGPGIFLYEIQQASDITYRVYDWDRPASAGRELHLDQAIRCVDPDPGEMRFGSEHITGRLVGLVSCSFFTLDRLALDPGAEATLATAGTTFHALTAVEGEARIEADAGVVRLGTHQTALLPASTGRYRIASEVGVTLMIASCGV